MGNIGSTKKAQGFVRFDLIKEFERQIQLDYLKSSSVSACAALAVESFRSLTGTGDLSRAPRCLWRRLSCRSVYQRPHQFRVMLQRPNNESRGSWGSESKKQGTLSPFFSDLLFLSFCPLNSSSHVVLTPRNLTLSITPVRFKHVTMARANSLESAEPSHAHGCCMRQGGLCLN